MTIPTPEPASHSLNFHITPVFGISAATDLTCVRPLHNRSPVVTGLDNASPTRNEVTSTTDQHYQWTGTSSRTRGHETIPLKLKEDIEDIPVEHTVGLKVALLEGRILLLSLFAYQTNKTHSTANRIKRGRQGSGRTPALVKAVRVRTRKNPCRKKTLFAKQMNVSKRTMRHMVNEDFGLRGIIFDRQNYPDVDLIKAEWITKQDPTEGEVLDPCPVGSWLKTSLKILS
ncbi:hypothetical protein TNCV_646611 [Trichonephila clavipes]|nr:hypothetical protein TNCV_646611 [Trichonephila clavipes]